MAWLTIVLVFCARVGQAKEVAVVNLIRHGEKSAHSGNGLTQDGAHRAEHLARCMSRGDLSQALPLGTPTLVMASHVRPGKSHRPADTAKPLARALGLTLDLSCDQDDGQCFTDRVQSHLGPLGTLNVVWHHGQIPMLAHALGVPKSLRDYARWPDACDNPRWPEPDEASVGDSSCYDLIWQVRVARGSLGEPWRAVSIAELHQGFAGDAQAACTAGLAPVSAEVLMAEPPSADSVSEDPSNPLSLIV